MKCNLINYSDNRSCKSVLGTVNIPAFYTRCSGGLFFCPNMGDITRTFHVLTPSSASLSKSSGTSSNPIDIFQASSDCPSSCTCSEIHPWSLTLKQSLWASLPSLSYLSQSCNALLTDSPIAWSSVQQARTSYMKTYQKARSYTIGDVGSRWPQNTQHEKHCNRKHWLERAGVIRIQWMSERSLETALVADEIRPIGSLGPTRHPLRLNGGKSGSFTLGFAALQYVGPSEMRHKIVLRSTV